MSKRTTLNHRYANAMIKAYKEVLAVTDAGGLAYETKSAIWMYDLERERVTLFVKEPSGDMTNQIIDYTKHNKNFEIHKNRIIKLTGAKPVTKVLRYDVA